MKSIAVAAFAATLALTSFSGVSAKEYSVSYNEIALRDIVGTRSVYRDITAEAKRICGAEGYALRNNMSKTECIEYVVEKSVREIDDKALTNIHKQRN